MIRRRILVVVASAMLLLLALGTTPALATNPCTHPFSFWSPSNTGSRTITPPGGSTAKITAWFLSTWVKDTYDPIQICYAISGNSSARWQGAVPYNATSIELEDTWHVDGLGVSLGYPAQLGITSNGNSITWPTTANNTDHNLHSFQDIWFKVAVPTGFWEQATGYFTFGSSSYNVAAYAQH